MVKRVFILFLFFAGSATLFCQEVITGLYSNPQVKKAWEKRYTRKAFLLADTIELPFFDDFAQQGLLPDSTRWQDAYVMINNTYTANQRTQGVATFDVLDNTGSLYPDASPSVFEADHLTSQPINLKYNPSDSIYLSFLYEPGGLADMPELSDSLIVQFYSPSDLAWTSVWKAPFTTTDTFRSAIIRITDPRFLEKGFMFRFINYASLSSYGTDQAMMGNCDQWNVDYILLGKNRNYADTIMHDVAMTKPVRSVLNTYESMPWKQFTRFFLSEMGSGIAINYFNNNTITRNVTRNFEIYDMYDKTVVYSVSGGAANIAPLSPVMFSGPLIYTFSTTNPDSGLFRIKSYLTTDVFDSKANDTITYFQRFSDYYAYDDGTAEAGYGINGLGSRNAMVAYRYSVYAADSLRGIMICFNQSYQNSNYTNFNLMVWDDNNGTPGNEIGGEQNLTVSQGPGLNGFNTYYLTSPVKVTGTYYVGWQQTTETFLNAGFDLNTPNNGRQFYFLNGNWNSSQAAGSVMIRPVFGPRRTTTGISDISYPSGKIKLWPNPAADRITLQFGEDGIVTDPVIVIRDLQGRELIRKQYTGQMDISSLSPGIYIVISYDGKRPIGFSRLIKSK
ncbi:MAG TPA: T9SS type A sorting domain-containing protein [Bacteroidales bacterium]|nr:T9SS type A sorting domain-containing protein [Bacteroidales bacterium]